MLKLGLKVIYLKGSGEKVYRKELDFMIYQASLRKLASGTEASLNAGLVIKRPKFEESFYNSILLKSYISCRI